jgi:hypothetical protein
MKKHLFFSLLLASFSVATLVAHPNPAFAQTFAQDSKKAVVAGYGIGNVKLGMSKANLIKALPYHYGTYKHTFGIEELLFRYTSGFSGQDAFFDVLLKGDKVFQIATSDKAFSAPGGINTGTPINL